MKHLGHSLLILANAIAWSSAQPQLQLQAPSRRIATAELKHPTTFPQRVWAACDFEGRPPECGWFGRAETNRIPQYPGNRTALFATERPYENVSAVMAGINPVPAPRMGKENGLFLRYFLEGGTQATFQHFSLTHEDNWHVVVNGLTHGRWDEVTINFTRDARRNDGSAVPFGEGSCMDDFKVFAGSPEQAERYQLLIDDAIFFANDPALPPEPEPFPNRVIFLADFDGGPKEKYWPGDFEIAERPPAGAWWRAAKSVPRPQAAGAFIHVPIEPPRPVGTHTKLRIRYHVSGATALTVQIFDATAQDNRHIRLAKPRQNAWTTAYLDFNADSHRNDGTSNASFPAGNLVDAVFFFVEGADPSAAVLHLDELVLFDAGKGPSKAARE